MTDQSPELKALLDVVDNKPRDPSKVVQICHFMDQLEYAYDKYTDTLPKPRTCPTKGCNGIVEVLQNKGIPSYLWVACRECETKSRRIECIMGASREDDTMLAWQSFYRNETGYPE